MRSSCAWFFAFQLAACGGQAEVKHDRLLTPTEPAVHPVIRRSSAIQPDEDAASLLERLRVEPNNIDTRLELANLYRQSGFASLSTFFEQSARVARRDSIVLYAPPEHVDGTVHVTKSDAEAAEEHFDGRTTE